MVKFYILVISILLLFTSCGSRPIEENERDLLAKLVYLEAGTCGQDCQCAIVSVVLNQLESGYWGDSIEEVIYEGGNYSVAHLLEECVRPPRDCYDAVDYVLAHGRTLPAEVRYFRANYDHSWEGYENYAVYDNVYFGYFTNDSH